MRRALLALSAALLASCGSGGPNAGGTVDFVDAAYGPFVKFDARPDLPNLLGIQAIVHEAPFGAVYGDPEIAQADAELRLYYSTSAGEIELAASPDGIAWTRVGVALAPSRAWEAGAVSGPTVFRDGAGWTMYYQGGAGAGVGRATSPDGAVFTKDPANPVLVPTLAWEAGKVANPSVRRHFDGRYRMLYDGAGGLGIGSAASPDGIAWAKEGEPAIPLGGPEDFDAGRASDPALLVERTALGREILRAWYTGREPGGDVSIGAAGSFDGVFFEKFAGNPVLDEKLAGGAGLAESEPSVLRAGGGFSSLYFAQRLGLSQGLALATNAP